MAKTARLIRRRSDENQRKMFATIVSILVIAGLTLGLMRIFEDWLFPSEKN